jgi:D-3-phosphoglycerate dehydrogenase
MKPERYFVIDFDSTFTQVESPSELAAISLKNEPDKEAILKEINKITDAAMEGKMPMAEALAKRLRLQKAHRKHIDILVKILKKKITPSVARNKKFFKEYGKNIFILSAGFKEFIIPTVKSFGIPEKNVFANTFVFDKGGAIIGLDEKNPLSHDKGKLEQFRRLDLKGEVYVIGDGYTDYELKESGRVTKFIAFTENVSRDIVVKNADHVARSFDEFLFLNKLPTSVSYPKSRMKVLLLENIHPDGVVRFKKEGYAVETLAKSISEDELCERIKDVSILGIRSKTEVTPKVLASAKKLMAIGAFCIGTNQIDLDECSKKGVAVFNAPYSNTRSVVELVVGGIIMLVRDVFDKSVKMHQGVWDKSAKGCFEIRGKKLGIIGYGNIGSQLSVVAESLGMEVYFYDVVEKLALGNAKKCVSMDELLKKSDVITLHIDGNPRNKNLISEREFKLMKPGVILLNLSRGFIIDISALARAITGGKVRGAAIDVFPHEPKSNDEEFVSELRGLPNVMLTPHIGGSTEEAQRNIGQFVSAKIADFVNAGNTYLSVNLPQLQLPELRNAHRFIHIHENMPGVLANINKLLAKHGINILGQYLKTTGTIGYVLTDVSKKYDKRVIDELRKVQHTIKFRALY